MIYHDEAPNALRSSTKFHLACLCGNKGIVLKLLNDDEHVTTEKDKFGRDGFLYSAISGKVHIAQLLHAHGASTTTVAKNGFTALHFAASWGHASMCHWLVTELQADIGARDKSGRMPLHVACLQGRAESAVFLMRALLPSRDEEKTKPFLLPVSKNGDSPFHLAACGGHIAMFDALLDELHASGNRPADITLVVDQPNEVGKSPLHVAIVFDNLEMVKYLVSIGADLERRTKDGQRPVDVAVACGHADIINFLTQSEEDMKTQAAAFAVERPLLHTPPSSGSGSANHGEGEGERKTADDDAAHATAVNYAQLLQRMDSGSRRQLLAISQQQAPSVLSGLPNSPAVLVDDEDGTFLSPRGRLTRRFTDSPLGRPSPKARSSLLAAQLSAGGLQPRGSTGMLTAPSSGKLLLPTQRSGDVGSHLGGSKGSAPKRFTFNDFDDTDDNSVTTDGIESALSSRRESRQSADSFEDDTW